MARVVRCPSCGATATPAAIQCGECSYCASALVGAPPGRQPVPVAGSATSPRSSAPLFVAVFLLLAIGGAVAMGLFSAGAVVTPATSSPVSAASAQPAASVAVTPSPPPVPEVSRLSPEAEPPALAAAGVGVLGAPEPEPVAPAREPTREERLAALPASEWTRLKGCLCRVDLDGKAGAETVQLGLHHLGTNVTVTGAGTRREHLLGFAALAGGAPAVLATTDDTAPPASLIGGRMGIGVACAGGKLLIASQSTVTAWSLTDWRPLWSTPLDGTFPRGESEEGGLSLDCHPLTEKRGVVTVAREGDRPLRVQVSDGSIAP